MPDYSSDRPITGVVSSPRKPAPAPVNGQDPQDIQATVNSMMSPWAAAGFTNHPTSPVTPSQSK